ncbi:MAG TPA: hypothetical protein VLQ52_04075 [Coriobacteriia bacterium]|nr:hypothetical protein [Coriobacteriia bacterium]
MDTTGGLAVALSRARESLHDRGNVVATGIGYKVTGGVRTADLAIICSVTEKQPLTALSADDVVPPDVDGFPTDVVATGPITALAVHVDRMRPAPGGVSIGHHRITAGTLGCVVHRSGEPLILSNNHVLANSNDALPGDAILQPGPIDGGTSETDRVATLDRFVPIVMAGESSTCAFANGVAAVANWFARLGGSNARILAVSERAADNLVDAATAAPLSPDLVSATVYGVGDIAGQSRAELGMPVVKSGRTTGVTVGEILQVDVTVDVGYGAGQVARFSDQVMAGAMSQGGDSGSAILDAEHRIVGLLFAGSERTTVINRIEHVFGALEIGV